MASGPVYDTAIVRSNDFGDRPRWGVAYFYCAAHHATRQFRAKITQIFEFPRKRPFSGPRHDPDTRTQRTPGKHRIQGPHRPTRPSSRDFLPGSSRGRRRSHVDRDLPDRQHRRPDAGADAGPALRRKGGPRFRGLSRPRPPQAGRRPAVVVRVQRGQVRTGQPQRFCGAVRRRFPGIGRRDDESAARQRPGLHPDGSVQAAHQPVRVPGIRRQVPALRFRTRRKIRHQSYLDGGDARIACRRDSCRLAGHRQTHRRHAADRHPQHPEFRVAEAGRQAAGVSGSDQARVRDHAGRIVERGGIPRVGGQPQGDLLSARHEDQHGRPASEFRRLFARSRGQEADADAGRNRSFALGRKPLGGARRHPRLVSRRGAGRHCRRQHGAGRLPSRPRQGIGRRTAGDAHFRVAAFSRRYRSGASNLPPACRARGPAPRGAVNEAAPASRNRREPMATEVELKLTTDVESLATVRRHPALAAVLRGRARTTKDVSTYYDTRSGELRKAGVALRVRRSGQRWLQTVKEAGDRVGALHRRPEYEWTMHTSRIDTGKLSTTPWRSIFEATAGRLRPVFVTAVDRTSQPLAFADGTRATLCLAAGEIRAGRKRAPLTEIEIELVQGEPRLLHELALSLAADLPLAMAQASKAERGYALASRAQRLPLRARKLALAPNASVGNALARFGGDCLIQIGVNAQSVAAGVDGEFVHQARVGIRRLRALLNLAAGLIGGATIKPLVQELQWLSTALGAARDWDVFASATLPAVSRTLRHPPSRRDVGTLRGRVTRLRHAHFAEASAAAASARLQRLLLASAALLASLESPAAVPAMRVQAKNLAKEVLERRARRLDKRGVHLRRASPAERHVARIAAKKLRYVAEMFAPLFPGSRTKAYLSALAKLQGALGHLNDLATGERLLDQLAPDARTEKLVHGAGIARGWLSGAEAWAVTDADRMWRNFTKCKTFWR